MTLRTYKLNAAREAVLKLARLRKPQREAFEFVHKLVETFDGDLSQLSVDDLSQRLVEAGVRFSDWPPEIVFELATGVGKTRLMGSLIAYLYRSGQTKNVLILAPRSAIVEKLEREVAENSQKYLLIDPALVSNPSVCVRSTIEGFSPSAENLNLFILTPQSVTGGERRFSRRTDFTESLSDYLRQADDLVVFVDEAHHVPGSAGADATAWREAVTNLQPKLQFGLSATPQTSVNSTVVYRYSLAECLQEGLYTKAVKLWIEQAPADIDEDVWDHTTLDFGLQRLQRKREALLEHAVANAEFTFIEPVMLVAARDTDHADKVANWLIENRGLTREEIHVAHSNRRATEAELAKLVAIDRPGNQIRVVVNVFQLTEGWDVTNVYVVVPLRAMATYQNAIQSMGRGLRLPAGKRTGILEIDRLDVLCFGRESFSQIVASAMIQFGGGVEGSAAIGLGEPNDESPAEPKKPVEIGTKVEKSFAVPNVHRIPPEPDLAFDITNSPSVRVVTGLDLATMDLNGAEDEILRYDYAHVVRDSTTRVLAALPFLSPAIHRASVEALIVRLLNSLGATESTVDVAIDPVRLALLVGSEISTRYKALPTTFSVADGVKKVDIASFIWNVPETFQQPPTKSSIVEWS